MNLYPDDKIITVRQSWLSDFTNDPERARLHMLHPELDTESDVASLGTSVHEAIELFLCGDLAQSDMVAYAQHRAEETIADDGITWIDLDPDRYIAHAGHLTQAWIEDLSPFVPKGGRSEVTFNLPTGHSIDHDGQSWSLHFTGTIDYIPPDPNSQGIWDWKTSGRAYQQWEKQRYAIQPSIYTWATVNGIMDDVRFPLDFTYGVMIRNERRTDGTPYAAPAKGQTVAIRRFESHGEWVIEQAKTAVTFALTYGTEQPWPRIDNHGLCSPKWCPWWSMCKGKHITQSELVWK